MVTGIYRHTFKAMNTEWQFQLCGSDAHFLRSAAEEMETEVSRLHHQLSLFEITSETSDANRDAGKKPTVLDPRFYQLLVRCASYSKQTDGAFDITVSPLMQAWKLQGGPGALPDPESIDRARQVTGSHLIEFDAEQHAVYLPFDGMAIDLGAVGKGYAIDCAVEIARDLGIHQALLHCGTSTVYGLGRGPDDQPWRIQVQISATEPVTCAVFELEDRALSVSAPHGKWFEANGRRYGHVLDPRTGFPVESALIAAVSLNSAEASDALSTALLTAGAPLLEGLKQNYPELTGMCAWTDAESDRTRIESIGVHIA
jgi:FAD:protein FMN transferase